MVHQAPRPGAVIAGFDAGQTHTTCRLARRSTTGRWEVLGEGEGPGVRHLAAAAGAEAFRGALVASLIEAMRACGLDGTAPGGESLKEIPVLPSLAAAAVGASGIEVGSGVQVEGRRLAAEALGLALAQVAVTGDERTALRGAMGDDPEGVVLISGTGTIAVGRNRAGREHRCAGWGWLLDGAGSALDIGRDGLSVSLAMADGRRQDAPWRRELWRMLGLEPEDSSTPQAIKALVVSPGFGPAGFARLAPVVAAAAADGDPTALAIVERSATALAEMATTISGVLNLVHPAIWPMGGALEHLPVLRGQLERQLGERLPQAVLARPAGDACSGALTLAAELVG